MTNTLVGSYLFDDLPGGPIPALYIDAAVARIRAHVGWHIAPVLTETVQAQSTDGRTFILPTLLLKTVTEIRWAGQVYAPGDFTTYRNGVVALNRWPRYYFPAMAESGMAEADIAHGYDECPPDLMPKIASLAMASAVPRDPALSRVMLGSMQAMYDQRAAGGLDSDDVLERYRLPAGVA